MTDQTKLNLKALGWSILTITLGYILLDIPYIKYVIEVLIVIIFLSNLFEIYKNLLIEEQKEPQDNQKKTKTATKKGKKNDR